MPNGYTSQSNECPIPESCLMLMEQKTKRVNYSITQIWQSAQDPPTQTWDSSLPSWENTKPYLDTLGSQPLNPKLTGKEAGSTTLNSPSSLKHQMQQKHNFYPDHAIELLPGAPTTMPGQLLPLNQKEIEEVHKFVQEHLM